MNENGGCGLKTTPSSAPAHIIKPVSYLAQKERDEKTQELKARANHLPMSHEYKHRRKC